MLESHLTLAGKVGWIMKHPQPKNQDEPKLVALGIVILVILAWNFWLPTAEDYYNMVTQGEATRQNDLTNVDFFVYYNTGTIFENGADVYYYEAPVRGETFSQYWYPPTFLPLYGLLSRLPYDQARLLWVVLYALAYLFTFGLLLFSVQKRLRLRLFFLALGLTLTSAPLLAHIHVGQADVFIGSLILSGFLLYTRQHRILSAFLFALATLMKVSPVFFLFFFVLFLRDFRFFVVYCLACAGIMLLSLFWVPAGLYPEYLLEILPEVGRGTSIWMNQSLLKYLAENRIVAQFTALGGMVGVAVFMGFVGRRYTRQDRFPHSPLSETDLLPLAAFLLNLLGIFILAGRLWSMAYTMTILPAALLLVLLLESRLSLQFKLTFCLGVFLINAKIYGYPLLDSLNLWGSILTAGLLVYLLLPDKASWLAAIQDSS